MHLSTLILQSLSAAVAIAAPSSTIDRRAAQCAQYASTPTGDYTVYNDLWGEGSASSGSQCYTVNSASGSSVSWSTTWTWQGGSGVKSYANAVVNQNPVQLSSISSMQSSWSWSYSGSSIVADVAYDMFTAPSSSASDQYEIMVWLAAIGGAQPISSSYSSSGAPVAVGSLTVDGTNFNLYKGPNGDTTVFSFVATNEVTNFSGDIKQFFNYLISNQGLSSSQYLRSVGAGTEATSGSDATFNVNNYSIVIDS